MKSQVRNLLSVMIPVSLFIALIPTMVLGLGVQASPGTGILYGTDANGGNLIRLNLSTGASTLVGNIRGFSVPSLAVDPTTGIMYAGGGGGVPYIYTVDPVTGAATLVGDTGLGEVAVSGMDCSQDGTLYAAVNIVGLGGTGADHLATIDKATGAATVIGPFGSCTGSSCTIEGIEGIAFDASGTLWGSHSARGAGGPPGLYLINPSTGAATFVTPIMDALGAPPSGGIVSIQFACDGTLYGGTARAIDQATDGGRLVIINPTTGLFEFVGTATATEDGSLGGLAFQNPCVIPPRPPPMPVVGGTVVGEDIFEVMMPWAALAGLLALATGVGLVIRRRIN